MVWTAKSQNLTSSIIAEATQHAATTSAHPQNSATETKETQAIGRRPISQLLHKAFKLKCILNLLRQIELQKSSLIVEIWLTSS